MDTDSGNFTYDGTGLLYSELIAGDEYYDLTFSGSGAWTLDANLTVNHDLTVTNGTLGAYGYITEEEADEVKKEELKYAEVNVPQAPHFALWVKEQLAEKYGDAVVEQGGLRVTTTLDMELGLAIVTEFTSSFQDIVNAQILPGQLRGVRLRKGLNEVAIDHEAILFQFQVALELAVIRVVFEQVGHCGQITQVVEGHHIEGLGSIFLHHF